MGLFGKKKTPLPIEEKLATYFTKLGLPSATEWLTFDDSQPDTMSSLSSYIPLSNAGIDNWQWLGATSTNKPLNNELANIRHVVAIASGKGGVGKSTTTVNIARALTSMGAKVGILDADIYGPSIPLMLNKVGQQPETLDGKIMEPLVSHEGIKANSIGFLVADSDAAIWRGPMASKALVQLFNETRWGDLDYLLIDLPPGTGDIQLTLSQQLPISGAVIVSTPQDIALIDAIKAVNMFAKVDIDVLGLIENMSIYTCDNCGHQTPLFGHGGAEQYAKEQSISFLGGAPLKLEIRSYMDKPAQKDLKQQSFFDCYENIAMRLAIELAKLTKQKSQTSLDIPFKQL